MEELQNKMRHNAIAVGVLVVILLLGGGYATYTSFTSINNLKAELSETESNLDSTSAFLSEKEQENAELMRQIENRDQVIDDLESEIRKASKNVDILTRLTTIDPELLKKYSKVYFLNEHYRPDDLKQIDKKYWSPEDDDEFVHADVWPHLEDLLEDAKKEGINFKIVSAFRTFDEQHDLKNHYNIVYGEGTANQFSAVQGYSEHQLGTTVDFTTEELNGELLTIDTEAYEWLTKRAHRYGFILSYPENNEYYQFEPWHWRFVGRELAKDLHEREISFYDMDQQEIDTYRLNIFED